MVLVDAAAAGILERSERLIPSIAEAGRSWNNPVDALERVLEEITCGPVSVIRCGSGATSSYDVSRSVMRCGSGSDHLV